MNMRGRRSGGGDGEQYNKMERDGRSAREQRKGGIEMPWKRSLIWIYWMWGEERGRGSQLIADGGGKRWTREEKKSETIEKHDSSTVPLLIRSSQVVFVWRKEARKKKKKEQRGQLCTALLVWELSSWATHHRRDEHVHFVESVLRANILCSSQLLPGVKFLLFHVDVTLDSKHRMALCWSSSLETPVPWGSNIKLEPSMEK